MNYFDFLNTDQPFNCPLPYASKKFVFQNLIVALRLKRKETRVLKKPFLSYE